MRLLYFAVVITLLLSTKNTAYGAVNSYVNQSVQEADSIYMDAHVLTMNRNVPTAQAVAVKDGTIIAVGNKKHILTFAGSQTKIHKMNGQTLMPGFIDSHSHLSLVAQLKSAADMTAYGPNKVRSIDNIVTGLQNHLKSANLAASGWLIGWGYDHSQLAENRHPTKEDLDAVSTVHPIVLMHFSGHQAVLNSVALELVNYTSQTPNPPSGVIARIPGSMEPNGIIQESAWLPVAARAFKFSPAQYASEIISALGLYIENGFTTVQNGILRTPEEIVLYRELAEKSMLPVDVIAFMDAAALTGKWGNVTPDQHYNNHFRLGGVKLLLDGGSPGRTAFLREPYHIQYDGEDNFRGIAYYPDQSVLNKTVASGYAKGWPMNIHALGDAAVDQAIKAVEFSQLAYPNDNRRTNLIHLQLIQADQYLRLAKLDVTLTFQVAHNHYFGDLHTSTIFGPGRVDRLNSLRSAMDAGLVSTIHHDAPVHPVDQMMLIYCAVNRITSSGAQLNPSEKVTVMEALEASTINAAYQYFEEDKKGSIEVGKIADFVILSKDPTSVDPMTIRDIKVTETIKDGISIFKAK